MVGTFFPGFNLGSICPVGYWVLDIGYWILCIGTALCLFLLYGCVQGCQVDFWGNGKVGDQGAGSGDRGMVSAVVVAPLRAIAGIKHIEND
jgi:hypothetical protein